MNKLTLSKLISDSLKELSISGREMMQRAGYLNLSHGSRILDHVLKGGYLKGGQFDMFAKGLDIEADMLKSAQEETIRRDLLVAAERIRIRQQWERENFTPFLEPVYRSTGFRIHFSCWPLYYSDTTIPLDQLFMSLSPGEKLIRVRQAIGENHETISRKVALARTITEYILHRDYDENDQERLHFDTQGELISGTGPSTDQFLTHLTGYPER